MDLRPDHIGLVVSDLVASIRFYELLGFRTESVMELEDGSRTIQFMRLEDFRLELFWSAGSGPADRTAKGDSRFRHLALRTDDIERTRAALVDADVLPVDAEIREVWGGLKLLYLSDPDGIEVEIMQRA